jgi:hypothetical protein
MAKAVALAPRQGLDRRLVAPGVQHGDDDGAGFQGAGLLGRGAAHLQHDVGAVQHGAGVGLHRGAGGGVVGVGNGGAQAGPGLDRDGRAQGDQLLDRLGRDGAARLAFATFTGDGDSDAKRIPLILIETSLGRFRPWRQNRVLRTFVTAFPQAGDDGLPKKTQSE